jgi:hypothetical protein
LPFDITIAPFIPELNQIPTVTVKDVETNTIGYPIKVPIVLSAKPADFMYLYVSFDDSVSEDM